MPDAHPCPAMLWTLLLLLATLLCAHGGRWDTATCTEGVVSVPRGRRAEMGCRIANAFSHVTVLLCVHGNHCQTIFSEEGPGNFSQGGWHLRVQGGVAQLVIEDAQTSQAGMYKWRLAGLQRNVRFTTLNVSEPQAPEDAPEESGGLRAPTQATEALRAPPQARQVAMERSVLAAAVLAGGAVLALSWRWCRGARTRAQAALRHLRAACPRHCLQEALPDHQSPLFLALPAPVLIASQVTFHLGLGRRLPGTQQLQLLTGRVSSATRSGGGGGEMARLPLLTLLLVLALLGALAAQKVQQSPPHTTVPEGGSVSITCCSHGPLSGVYLVRSEPGPMNVIYYEDGKEPTVDEAFWARVEFSGSQQNLTVTLLRLRPADTGTYTCQAIMEDSILGPGTHVVVTDKLAQDARVCQDAGGTGFALPATFAVVSFLIGLGLGVLCALSRVQIKKLLSGRTESSAAVIYEDMSCSRPCTLAVPNQYL